MAEFPLPKGYQRMNNFPLDASSLFTTLAALQDYALNNGTAYAGQICSVNDGDFVKVYKINVDLSVSEIGVADLPPISVANLAARDAILTQYRTQGMEVFVISEQLYFSLIGGITNNSWVQRQTGGSGGGEWDGGSASSTYVLSEIVDGGGA